METFAGIHLPYAAKPDLYFPRNTSDGRKTERHRALGDTPLAD